MKDARIVLTAQLLSHAHEDPAWAASVAIGLLGDSAPEYLTEEGKELFKRMMVGGDAGIDQVVEEMSARFERTKHH